MKLIDAYADESACQDLYQLLKKRTEQFSISHAAVPDYAQHVEFYRSKPYRVWYIIEQDGQSMGSAYITENNEIGVFVIDEAQELEQRVLQQLISTHSPLPAIKSRRAGSFSLNVNPSNQRLIDSALALGGQHIQNTYRF